MPDAKRLRAIVQGRVQGVNFRHYTRREATQRGLTGYVRNRPDGNVEVVAEGQAKDLESFLAFLRVGPRAAFVTDVDVAWADPAGTFDRFEVRY